LIGKTKLKEDKSWKESNLKWSQIKNSNQKNKNQIKHIKKLEDEIETKSNFINYIKQNKY